MGKSTNAPKAGTTSTVKRGRGKAGAALLVVGAKAGSLIAFLAVVYVIVMFAGIRVVPLTLGFVKDGTGISASDPTLTVLAVFVAPGLFFVALITTAVIFGIRGLWRLRAKLVDGVAGWALGREDAPVTDIVRGSTRATRSTKSA